MLVAGLLSAVIFGAVFSVWMTELMAKSRWLPVVMGLVAALPAAFAALLWFAFTQTRVINATFNLTTVSTNARVQPDSHLADGEALLCQHARRAVQLAVWRFPGGSTDGEAAGGNNGTGDGWRH